MEQNTSIESEGTKTYLIMNPLEKYLAALLLICFGIANQVMIGRPPDGKGLDAVSIIFFVISVFVIVIGSLKKRERKLPTEKRDILHFINKRLSLIILLSFVVVIVLFIIKILFTGSDIQTDSYFTRTVNALVTTLSALVTTVVGYYYGNRTADQEREKKSAIEKSDIEKENLRELLTMSQTQDNVPTIENRRKFQRKGNDN